MEITIFINKDELIERKNQKYDNNKDYNILALFNNKDFSLEKSPCN